MLEQPLGSHHQLCGIRVSNALKTCGEAHNSIESPSKAHSFKSKAAVTKPTVQLVENVLNGFHDETSLGLVWIVELQWPSMYAVTGMELR